ncbi:uncharacterized mitochondrial protein AtMg00810-like [Vitis riparia]|uniref:uncharacterized mitochondrial protein AtMg00810-like n=1 Tax=Vitis riparia TaxID=96939 RepID=UPI00155A5ADE|nr:uncharacterized mitochondrial protein AtMg00810-like [Vitis riparia]
MVSNQSLSNSGSAPFSNTQLYKSTIGVLQYATITRLDITYSVNRVCQFMQAPLTAHWKAVKRILCYLDCTLHHGLHLQHNSNSHLNLIGYFDVDWASYVDDRHSTSGYCLFLGPNLVSWHSRHTVSKSSTEAEYRSILRNQYRNTCLQSIQSLTFLNENGSVVDSVDGAFLTQNASDSLSNNSVQSTPEPAISIHDGLYEAIDSYSKAHQNLIRAENERQS